jgi:hypothetical protein
VASAITSAGFESDGCAIVMARLFKSYQRYLNDNYASYFQDYEKKIFSSLDAENKRALT